MIGKTKQDLTLRAAFKEVTAIMWDRGPEHAEITAQAGPSSCAIAVASRLLFYPRDVAVVLSRKHGSRPVPFTHCDRTKKKAVGNQSPGETHGSSLLWIKIRGRRRCRVADHPRAQPVTSLKTRLETQGLHRVLTLSLAGLVSIHRQSPIRWQVYGVVVARWVRPLWPVHYPVSEPNEPRSGGWTGFF